MRFLLNLNDSYNNEKHQKLCDLGYDLICVAKHKPKLIFVENKEGSIKELEEIPFVYRVRKERMSTLIS